MHSKTLFGVGVYSTIESYCLGALGGSFQMTGLPYPGREASMHWPFGSRFQVVAPLDAASGVRPRVFGTYEASAIAARPTAEQLRDLEERITAVFRKEYPNVSVPTSFITRNMLRQALEPSAKEVKGFLAPAEVSPDVLMELHLRTLSRIEAADVELILSHSLACAYKPAQAIEDPLVVSIDPESGELFQSQIGVGLREGPAIDLVSLALLSGDYRSHAEALISAHTANEVRYEPRPYELPVNEFLRTTNKQEIEQFLDRESKRQEELLLLHLIHREPCNVFELSRDLRMKSELVQRTLGRLERKGDIVFDPSTSAFSTCVGEKRAKDIASRDREIQKTPLMDDCPVVSEVLALSLRRLGLTRATVLVIPHAPEAGGGASWRLYY